jgi:hypothetical protein
MLRAVRASCYVPHKLYTLALEAEPAHGPSLPTWEELPLSDSNLRLLEFLIRQRWITVARPLPTPHDKEAFATRGDQDWEVLRRAIAQARRLQNPVVLERLVVDARSPIAPQSVQRVELLRLRIDAPTPTEHVLRHLAGSLEYYVRLYGLTGELYARYLHTPAVPVDGASSEVLSGAATSLYGSGRAIVNFQTFPYMVSIGSNQSLYIEEFLVGTQIVAIRDICELRARQARRLGKELP